MTIKSIIHLIFNLFTKKKNNDFGTKQLDDAESIAELIENDLVCQIEEYIKIFAYDSNKIKDETWVVFHSFYNNLTPDQQQDFMVAMQHIMIDTASGVINTITTYGHPDQGIIITNHKGDDIHDISDNFLGKYQDNWRLPLKNTSN